MARTVLSTLRLCYPAAFEKAYPDDETVGAAQKAYAAKLEGFTPKEVLKGLDKATNSKFMPTPAEIRLACQLTPEDLGLPSTDDAHEQIKLVMNAPAGQFDWRRAHPALYYTYTHFIDVHRFKHLDSKKHLGCFKQAYEQTLSLAKTGFEFPEPPKFLGHSKHMRTPKERGRDEDAHKKNMAKMKGLFGGASDASEE